MVYFKLIRVLTKRNQFKLTDLSQDLDYGSHFLLKSWLYASIGAYLNKDKICIGTD